MAPSPLSVLEGAGSPGTRSGEDLPEDFSGVRSLRNPNLSEARQDKTLITGFPMSLAEAGSLNTSNLKIGSPFSPLLPNELTFDSRDKEEGWINLGQSQGPHLILVGCKLISKENHF